MSSSYDDSNDEFDMEEDEAISILLAWRANKKPKIGGSVTKYDTYFVQKRNAAGELGYSTYQKVTAALRMLAYGILADLIDDHLAMGESTAIKCVKRFVVAIVQVFGATYLRAPNDEDTARLLEENAARRLLCTKVHKWSLNQMVVSTTMATILPTASTQGDKHL
jgi:hypothetical protein